MNDDSSNADDVGRVFNPECTVAEQSRAEALALLRTIYGWVTKYSNEDPLWHVATKTADARSCGDGARRQRVVSYHPVLTGNYKRAGCITRLVGLGAEPEPVIRWGDVGAEITKFVSIGSSSGRVSGMANLGTSFALSPRGSGRSPGRNGGVSGRRNARAPESRTPTHNSCCWQARRQAPTEQKKSH